MARLLELFRRQPHRVPNFIVSYADRVVLDIFARNLERPRPEGHRNDRICDDVWQSILCDITLLCELF